MNATFINFTLTFTFLAKSIIGVGKYSFFLNFLASHTCTLSSEQLASTLSLLTTESL